MSARQKSKTRGSRGDALRRLWRVWHLLREQGPLSSGAVSRSLGIIARTVRRDLDMLVRVGAGVTGERNGRTVLYRVAAAPPVLAVVRDPALRIQATRTATFALTVPIDVAQSLERLAHEDGDAGVASWAGRALTRIVRRAAGSRGAMGAVADELAGRGESLG